jgi:hypothetical protein
VGRKFRLAGFVLGLVDIGYFGCGLEGGMPQLYHAGQQGGRYRQQGFGQ